jgi:MerR family transcriptional regulator, aldehyde-responsive regulator
MSQMDYFSVKQTSEKTGISEHTLRYYERIGLIGAVRRSSGGQRQYSGKDLEWIDFLKCLRSTGMSIEHMVEYADCLNEGDDNFERRLSLMREHKSVILSKMGELKSFLEAIEWKINFYRELKEKYENEQNDA